MLLSRMRLCWRLEGPRQIARRGLRPALHRSAQRLVRLTHHRFQQRVRFQAALLNREVVKFLSQSCLSIVFLAHGVQPLFLILTSLADSPIQILV